MHLICPHCQSPIELVNASAVEEVQCPSCGSSFRLKGGTTTGWTTADGPRKLGRFELIDAVGSGAFGTVYKARDPQVDRVVALKVPRAGNLPGGGDLDRFLREARSAAQLKHPSIVPVHEVGQHEGTPYLVSDFVQGVTLADLLTGGEAASSDWAPACRASTSSRSSAHWCSSSAAAGKACPRGGVTRLTGPHQPADAGRSPRRPKSAPLSSLFSGSRIFLAFRL